MDDIKLDSRVAALEAGMDNLTHSLDRLASDVQRSVDSLSEDIRRISGHVSARSGTNWGVLGTWFAAAIALVAALGTLALMPLRQDQADLAAMFRQHELMHGHPAADLALTELKRDYTETKAEIIRKADETARDLKSLDTGLQREMRDLDTGQRAEMAAKVKSLDERLQTEFGLIVKRFEQAEINNASQLKRVFDWIDDHDKRVLGVNAAQWERIRALERQAYGRPAPAVSYGSSGSQLED